MDVSLAFKQVLLDEIPDKNITPGTAEGTQCDISDAVASPISSGVTVALVKCFFPGCGNDGLIKDPTRATHISKAKNEDE